MAAPKPSDIARVLPAALAETGGSATLSGLEAQFSQGYKFKITGMNSKQQAAYLQDAFRQAIDILVRLGSAETRNDRVHLTDRGWFQAEQLGVPRPPEEPAATPGVTVDLGHALAYVEIRRSDGTLISGYLNEDAAARFHGRPFVPPASALLDALYRAEVDGARSSDGFYTTAREMGASVSAIELLKQKCRVALIGLDEVTRPARSSGTPKRSRVSWERLVCETIGALGGNAEWATIAESIGRNATATEFVSWREESRQALRNHTAPSGRSYFEVAEIGDRTVYTLTEKGKRLAARRTEDQRAPTLSKLLAKAVAPDDDSKLTDYELYALFTLAVELGKPAEAEAIYHRLPENFPDEDRYYMARHLLDRARELRQGLQS